MAYTDIDKSDDYFNTILYSGNNTANRSITGVGFQPDWVWIKGRSGTYGAYGHFLFDAVRGVGKQFYSNNTSAEATNLNNLYSFDSDGFSLGQSGADPVTNGSSTEFVAWNWLSANGTASNTDGSITSTVSANTTSGFSIVSWTGNQTAGASCGHGLGVAPSMIIKRRRNGDGADYWYVYHKSLGSSKSIYLNTTDASETSGAWNSQNPTSTVFYHGSSIRENGNNMIAYCFAEKKGFSKFGIYTGNGSSDGVFNYTGFKPAFIVLKQTSAAGQNWQMMDNKRNAFNVLNRVIYPNLSQGEDTTGATSNTIDFVSNGFKSRGSNAQSNGSGSTYIYMAFAENPFVTSTGIPACAR